MQPNHFHFTLDSTLDSFLPGGFGVATPGPDGGTIRMQHLGRVGAAGGEGLLAPMVLGPGGRVLDMSYEGLQQLEDVKVRG